MEANTESDVDPKSLWLFGDSQSASPGYGSQWAGRTQEKVAGRSWVLSSLPIRTGLVGSKRGGIEREGPDLKLLKMSLDEDISS